MKVNEYFNGMKNTLTAWRARRDEHAALKQTVIDTYGWESEELKAWYREDNAIKYPYSGGEGKAYRAWSSSVDRSQTEFEMDDFLWETEVHDFVETLRKAGVKSFVYTNESTAVMENLHAFAAEGCELAGLCTIACTEDRFGEDKPVEGERIRFKVK